MVHSIDPGEPVHGALHLHQLVPPPLLFCKYCPATHLLCTVAPETRKKQQCPVLIKVCLITRSTKQLFIPAVGLGEVSLLPYNHLILILYIFYQYRSRSGSSYCSELYKKDLFLHKFSLFIYKIFITLMYFRMNSVAQPHVQSYILSYFLEKSQP